MIRIVAKTLGPDEKIIGSISVPQHIILNGGLANYTQWITLFEHEDDDEYDGSMGENDDEEPRILVNFLIQQDNPPSVAKPKTMAVAETTLQ